MGKSPIHGVEEGSWVEIGLLADRLDAFKKVRDCFSPKVS